MNSIYRKHAFEFSVQKLPYSSEFFFIESFIEDWLNKGSLNFSQTNSNQILNGENEENFLEWTFHWNDIEKMFSQGWKEKLLIAPFIEMILKKGAILEKFNAWNFYWI